MEIIILPTFDTGPVFVSSKVGRRARIKPTQPSPAQPQTHRSVGPLLAAVLAGPPPQVRRVLAGALHVHAVDDVEELLHHGHPLEHELDLAVATLRMVQSYDCFIRGKLDLVESLMN